MNKAHTIIMKKHHIYTTFVIFITVLHADANSEIYSINSNGMLVEGPDEYFLDLKPSLGKKALKDAIKQGLLVSNFAHPSNNRKEIVPNTGIKPIEVAMDAFRQSSQQSSTSQYQQIEIGPFVPWPPPISTSTYLFPKEQLSSFRGVKISNFSERFANILRKSGYHEFSYFSAPGGFTLTTRLEKIDEDENVENLVKKSDLFIVASNYIYRLLHKNEGRFRIFVFVLTTDNKSKSSKQSTIEDAKRWSRNGAGSLSDSIKDKVINSNHEFYALVYEYVVPKGEEPKMLDTSSISSYEHVKKSGVSFEK